MLLQNADQHQCQKAAWRVIATNHFRDRVAERIGPNVDPDVLAVVLGKLIDMRSDQVRFVTRCTCKKVRVFWFNWIDGRNFYVLINTGANTAVTVLPEGYEIKNSRHQVIKLRGAP